MKNNLFIAVVAGILPEAPATRMIDLNQYICGLIL